MEIVFISWKFYKVIFILIVIIEGSLFSKLLSENDKPYNVLKDVECILQKVFWLQIRLNGYHLLDQFLADFQLMG